LKNSVFSREWNVAEESARDLEAEVPTRTCELGKLQAPKARSCDCRIKPITTWGFETGGVL